MEFVIGLFAGIGFFVLVAVLLYIGYRLGNKPNKTNPTKRELTEQEQLKKDFQAMMNYDLDIALGRKVSE
jgi:hypothetical protein